MQLLEVNCISPTCRMCTNPNNSEKSYSFRTANHPQQQHYEDHLSHSCSVEDIDTLCSCDCIRFRTCLLLARRSTPTWSRDQSDSLFSFFHNLCRTVQRVDIEPIVALQFTHRLCKSSIIHAKQIKNEEQLVQPSVLRQASEFRTRQPFMI